MVGSKHDALPHWTCSIVMTIWAFMTRRLLTLLVILTGLAAMGAPAHARLATLQDVGVHAMGESAVKCQGKRFTGQERPLDRLGARTAQKSNCSQTVITIVIPTVHLHVDRSRE